MNDSFDVTSSSISSREIVRTVPSASRIVRLPPVSDATTPVHITVSVGVVAMEAGELSLETLLQMADHGLYAAKAAGRNCVAVLQAPGQQPRIASC